MGEALGYPGVPRKSSQVPIFVDHTLTLSQMFKYALIRGINDIRFMFNNSEGPSLRYTRREIERANGVAEPVWLNRQKRRTARMADCRQILAPVLDRMPSHSIHPKIPDCLLKKLNAIFEQNYGGGEQYLLMGRAEDDAYAAQANYVDAVLRKLSSYHQFTKARVLTCIGKAYGLTSVPILSTASVSALWQACKSEFYKRQLAMVSQTCLHACVLADLGLSFTAGSSRSQNPSTRRESVATTYRL